MYVNSGYLNNSRVHFKDHTRPLIVGSCGTYRLSKYPKLPTWWPKGRLDYQLLYIAAGKTHFFFGEREEIVESGHIVLYGPGEPQKYNYFAVDHPEVFWVHFTGYDVKNILNYYNLSVDKHVYYVGTIPEYKWIFRRMIQEMQMRRPLYEEWLASLLNDLFLLMDRQILEGYKSNSNIQHEIKLAASFFHENYNRQISIEEYAQSRHISVGWFIRNFKLVTSMTPIQYILSIRISNAQSLLEHSNYNVSEVAGIVGYDNPLYFSRVFKKQVGLSPAQYRKEQIAKKIK